MQFSPAAQRLQRQNRIQANKDAHARLKESSKLYNELVGRCYSECVTSFLGKKLTGKERTCVDQCTEKYFKFKERCSRGFKEGQMAVQQAADARNQAELQRQYSPFR